MVIQRRSAADVALIDADELRGLMETAYLLWPPTNAERLLSAIRRAGTTEFPIKTTKSSSKSRLKDTAMIDLDWAVHSDPEILSGVPVFVGTRVPFQALIDYLGGGQPRRDFLDDFPTVTHEQAVLALRQAAQALVADAHPA